jgi:short-subunit dehydrogenase
VQSVQADLSTIDGVDTLLATAKGRTIDLLCRQCRDRPRAAPSSNRKSPTGAMSIDTNITGTVYLLQKVLKEMVARGAGKVLVTGSIAGYIPGSFKAVYNGTKAFVDNFTEALRNEIKDVEGVTLTTLMPGPTDTEFFARADMLDTKVGKTTTRPIPPRWPRTVGTR